MSLTNRERCLRFYDGLPTPPHCYRLRSTGERLMSYNYELARHGLVCGQSGNIHGIVLIRDRCHSSNTTNRHYREAYSSDMIQLSPDNYPAGSRATFAAVPYADGPLSGASVAQLWEYWLRKIEQERGPAARAWAARRLKRFRKKMEMQTLIEAL